jgi:hypothetical protein
MEDSVISFRNDETDRDANKLYRRVTRFLRKVLKQNQDTNKDEEITATMLYEVENNNSRYMKPKMKRIQRE